MKAQLKTYRQSPRKVRLVSDLVKGKSVEEAIRLLKVTTKSAAKPLCKLIESAAKNAKNSLSGDTVLYIKDFRVDAGVTLKRSMPRARGSAFQILKSGLVSLMRRLSIGTIEVEHLPTNTTNFKANSVI